MTTLTPILCFGTACLAALAAGQEKRNSAAATLFSGVSIGAALCCIFALFGCLG